VRKKKKKRADGSGPECTEATTLSIHLSSLVFGSLVLEGSYIRSTMPTGTGWRHVGERPSSLDKLHSDHRLLCNVARVLGKLVLVQYWHLGDDRYVLYTNQLRFV